MGLATNIIAVVLACILGSISSAYIVGRFMGKIDMIREGDGRISASLIHEKMGVVPFLLVVVIDVGEGALAILIAKLLTDSLIIMLISGFVAVAGHDWSFLLKFRGGMGATTTYGVLVALAWWQTLAAAAVAGIVMFTIKKSGLSTAILIGVLAAVLLVQYLFQSGPLILAIYPIILILLMVLKRFQLAKTGPR
jgi:glycerol-3-phosphate acyltransferase PlsY